MKSIFDRQNPWRPGGYSFPKEKYIHREIHQKIIDHLDKKEISILLGSRQVGKTFTMKKLIEHLIDFKHVRTEQVFYFNMDVVELVELFQDENQFLTFLKTYGPAGVKLYAFIDEAQRISNCGLLLKRYYDLEMNVKFIVSGSSSLEIKSQVKETLTGRKKLFEILPISFNEFIKFKGLNPATPIEQKLKFESTEYERLLHEFILFGGYPGVVKLNTEEEKIDLLYEIYNSYIQKDISDFLKVTNIIGFNRLVKILAAQNTGLLKISELSKIIGLSRHYVEQYLQFLEETYIIKILRPYFKNLGKTIIKTPKVYFIDTGIYNSVFKQFQHLDNRSDHGQLAENFVFSELIKRYNLDQMWFYRTNNGTEVDFIIQVGSGLKLIEVKYSTSRQSSIPKIFRSLQERLDVQEMSVITKSYSDDRKLFEIPVRFRPLWDAFEVI